MDIEVFADGLTIEDIGDVPHKTGCRAVIKKDDKYLVVRLKKWDITTFPGGGLEENETLEECCVREVLEETGITCKVIQRKISVTEYFLDSIWTNVYFSCEYIKDTGETNYTQEEIDLGLEKSWKTLEELMDILENNMTLHENGPAIHSREFLGLIHSI